MKKEERKNRISLTLLFALVTFCILFVSVLLTLAIISLLARLGVMTNYEEGISDTTTLMLFMALISLIIGSAIAVAAGRIPLKPINRIITQLNRLASGDFKARIYFGKPLSDIPAFTEARDSFNKMAQELENTEMLRSDFINNFSHEFKTPIVSIAGFAKLLRRGDLTQEQREEYLAIIEEESLRLADMATNVMNLTKIENQTILTDVNTFNLSEQLRSCVLLMEDKWSRRELTIDLEFEEHGISANEELLKQVWINLLDNAIKFSPVTGEILIRITDEEKNLCVHITNFGSEIPAEKLDKIWNKFYQADESHASQGNGIGLAIVNRVTDLHGGRADVESSNGKTTFTVTLPK